MKKLDGNFLCFVFLLALPLLICSRSAAADNNNKDSIRINRESVAKIHPSLPAFRFRLYFDGTCPGIYVLKEHDPEIIQDLSCPEMDSKFELKVIDINFDGYKDLMLLSFDAHNQIYTYWIFDKATGRFEPEIPDEPPYDANSLSNPIIDAKHKKLITEDNGLEETMVKTFQYQGGKRILVKEEKFHYQDGKRILVKETVFQGDRKIIRVRKNRKMIIVNDTLGK